ncbi:putative RNA recognition motif domain, nucleotide-binding alpha-beta plait domain superfamily [Helianthus annuus]|nr:putative RNA recognition motif domain, nucleotide-binding alpha-beta plait domain superfamily [Helianthus annuus]
MGNHRKPIPVEIQARVTKFYVANLPDRCSGNDLAGEVRKYGMIFDIYIAWKRDKEGKRFGFLSLLDVKDRVDMVKKLSQIKMGEYRLKVNVARFVLEDGEINDSRPKTHYQPRKKDQPNVYSGAGIRQPQQEGSFSYKDAFFGANPARLVEVDDDFQAFDDEIGRAVLVRVSSIHVLKNIVCILKEMGLAEGKIRNLGGFTLMVSFKTKEHAVMAKVELLGRPDQFSSAVIWEGQEVDYDRVAWLRIYGIPVNVMGNSVIEDVGRLFGMVVKSAQLDADVEDVSSHRVGVLVNATKTIQEEAFIRWRRKTYKVWVLGDSKDWFLEFLVRQRNDTSSMEEGSPSSPMPDSGPEFAPENIINEEENITENHSIEDKILVDSVNNKEGGCENIGDQNEEVNLHGVEGIYRQGRLSG